jgi:FixJ family two-component response regulator
MQTNNDFSVFLVDDDPGILKALARLLSANGYKTQSFTSSKQFLDTHDPSVPGCAIVDLAMPGLDGLAVQDALAKQGGAERQVIFLSGRSDVPHTVRAMRAGAVDFLEKPVNARTLLSAVSRAAAQDIDARQASSERKVIMDRIDRLTPREIEVMRHVIAGRLNKQIAADLGTVEKTVKVHRSRMMAKMGVRTVAELVRLTEKIEFRPFEPPLRGPKGQLDAVPLSRKVRGMSGAKMCIAIVDDDLSVRKALARLLRANSFEVETYDSARAFLDSLTERKPQCLILDLHMPDYSGFDLRHHLQRKGIDIPTVIITAYNEPDLPDRCASAGAAAFLIKPLTNTALLDSISRATAKH